MAAVVGYGRAPQGRLQCGFCEKNIEGMQVGVLWTSGQSSHVHEPCYRRAEELEKCMEAPEKEGLLFWKQGEEHRSIVKVIKKALRPASDSIDTLKKYDDRYGLENVFRAAKVCLRLQTEKEREDALSKAYGGQERYGQSEEEAVKRFKRIEFYERLEGLLRTWKRQLDTFKEALSKCQEKISQAETAVKNKLELEYEAKRADALVAKVTQGRALIRQGHLARGGECFRPSQLPPLAINFARVMPASKESLKVNQSYLNIGEATCRRFQGIWNNVFFCSLEEALTHAAGKEDVINKINGFMKGLEEEGIRILRRVAEVRNMCL